MRLATLPFVVVTACGLIAVARAAKYQSAWRAGRTGERLVTRSFLARVAARTVRGAAFGVVLVTTMAASLIAVYHKEERAGGEFVGLGTAIFAMASYLIGVPVASWIGLRALAVRPAWLAAFGAWGLLGCELVVISYTLEDLPSHAWIYGVLALLSYVVATAATAWVPDPDEDREVRGIRSG